MLTQPWCVTLERSHFMEYLSCMNISIIILSVACADFCFFLSLIQAIGGTATGYMKFQLVACEQHKFHF